VRTAALLLGVFVVVGCHGAESPSTSPGTEKDVCAIGSRTTRPCAKPFTCKPVPLAPRAAVAGDDSFVSDETGPCGGVAGFHCAEGLVCDMPVDQEMTSDGMGTCARSSVCSR
jgi:hypothetical protein